MLQPLTFLRWLACAALLAATAAQAQGSHPADSRRSGYEFMSPSTQALQKDDSQNPGMLWVQDGRALWQKNQGASNKACATCHGDAASSMKGVATRYPAFDGSLNRPVNLQQRINQCRVKHQQAQALPAQGPDSLGLESFVGLQSRGLPINPPPDERLAIHRAKGEQLFHQRMGQLNLSCAQCHNQLAGQRLGGSTIPQAHPTGYPQYRLEWQAVGALQRRLRNCMTGVRAQPYAWDAAEMLELELYLAQRAQGMVLETPGVRP
ncbi:MAG: sulfur oxidation c-type cytochrome SoxA [Burkholderiales bacterium]